MHPTKQRKFETINHSRNDNEGVKINLTELERKIAKEKGITKNSNNSNKNEIAFVERTSLCTGYLKRKAESLSIISQNKYNRTFYIKAKIVKHEKSKV